MKAVVYKGRAHVAVEEVPDPVIVEPTDAIVKVTAAGICGSDLHLYGGYLPGMVEGDIMGHEFMGKIVELGAEVTNLQKGDRVVVPFHISCGDCFFCRRQLWALCDRTNPNHRLVEQAYGQSPAGMFGYTHMFGAYNGGQAEYVRVPYANIGALKIPDGLTDDQVLFLGDVFPAGYMAAENANISPGDTVAIWGAGAVGQLVAKSAQLLGAGRLIIIDRLPERLELAEQQTGAIALNYDSSRDLIQTIKDLTDGRGPDSCIDAVGLESHAHGVTGLLDRARHNLHLEVDRTSALRDIIQVCRKGGTVSIAGVYGGILDKFPLGAAFNKGLTLRLGQAHVHKYMQPLLEKIIARAIDPSFVITHHLPLREAPSGYDLFQRKRDGCIKVILKP